MPSLNRTPNEKELEKLVSIYLRAETAIINEIGRLRSQGLVDYHAVAAWSGCRPSSGRWNQTAGNTSQR